MHLPLRHPSRAVRGTQMHGASLGLAPRPCGARPGTRALWGRRINVVGLRQGEHPQLGPAGSNCSGIALPKWGQRSQAHTCTELLSGRQLSPRAYMKEVFYFSYARTGARHVINRACAMQTMYKLLTAVAIVASQLSGASACGWLQESCCPNDVCKADRSACWEGTCMRCGKDGKPQCTSAHP